jgi:hypothetical protein
VQERTLLPLSQLNAAPQNPRPASSGIPSVRSSAPGDHVRDYARLKEAWKARTEEETSKIQGGVDLKPLPAHNVGDRSLSPISAENKSLQQPRRFHLTHHLSSIPGPSNSRQIQRRKIDLRPPLATFIERYTVSFKHQRNPIYQSNPVDKVIDLQHDQSEATQLASGDKPPILDALQSSKRAPTKSFVIAEAQSERKGTSIQDHPSTWDHDSDQLADELAALAMEFDPEAKIKAAELEANVLKSPPPTAVPDDSDRMALDDNDFVYETYIKVQHDQGQTTIVDIDDWDNKVGVLVIDEEVEDLWNKYVDSDHDDDWDEEDSNGESKLFWSFSHANPPSLAEDNPANDYPEDEVSSDDQFSRNPYKYRQYDSDNEYDDDYDDKW